MTSNILDLEAEILRLRDVETTLRAELAAARDAAIRAGAILNEARLCKMYRGGPLHEPWTEFVVRLCDDETVKGTPDARK